MNPKNNFIIKILIMVGVFVSVSNSFCQTFKLTEINTEMYSIDKISQEIYFKDLYSDTVRKVNLKNMEVNKTDYIYLPPILSNKRHLLVYGYTLYDIDIKLSFGFDISDADSFGYVVNASFPGSFSPNDSMFMYGNPKYYVPIKDSVLKPVSTGLSIFQDVNYSGNDAFPKWSSDTSFVFLSIHNNVILEYFLKSGRLDTLVVADTTTPYPYLLSFDYNTNYNLLAYSTTEKHIYLHDKENDKDSLIFSPNRDDSDNTCWSFGVRGITSLCWSPDNTKLAFLNFQFINISVAGIYIYSLDSNQIYKATDCNDYGLKFFLQWANNDTLIYVNTTDANLYGIDVSSIITSIGGEKIAGTITDISIFNYPNPFNNTTTINFNLPVDAKVVVKIYDAIGNEIHQVIDNNLSAGNHVYNINLSQISSGVYFYNIEAAGVDGSKFSSVRKMMLMK